VINYAGPSGNTFASAVGGMGQYGTTNFVMITEYGFYHTTTDYTTIPLVEAYQNTPAGTQMYVFCNISSVANRIAAGDNAN
jgi:hypothetical protein